MQKQREPDAELLLVGAAAPIHAHNNAAFHRLLERLLEADMQWSAGDLYTLELSLQERMRAKQEWVYTKAK